MTSVKSIWVENTNDREMDLILEPEGLVFPVGVGERVRVVADTPMHMNDLTIQVGSRSLTLWSDSLPSVQTEKQS